MEARRKIVVPATMREPVISLNHDLPTAGLKGVAKTLERVKEKFWWKNMDEEVLEYVRTCRSCSQRSNYEKNRALFIKFNHI